MFGFLSLTDPTTEAPAPGKPLCRHCRARLANRPRGLCWHCYYAPGVRENYPSTSKFARLGVLDKCGPVPLPVPTRALPGTPEKFLVLCERAARREQLFHPRDAPNWRGVATIPSRTPDERAPQDERPRQTVSGGRGYRCRFSPTVAPCIRRRCRRFIVYVGRRFVGSFATLDEAKAARDAAKGVGAVAAAG